MSELEQFIAATIRALYFTETGDESQPDQHAELAPETLARLKADCTSFWYRMHFYIKPAGQTIERAGFDFWLTRNGHGAGFWDGDWPEPYGEMLTKLAKTYGEFEICQGDDGLIWS